VQLMQSFGWEYWLFAVVAVTAFRLILAPYWLAKEDAKKIATLEAARATKEKREAIRRGLGGFIEEGQHIRQDCHQRHDMQMPAPEPEFTSWLDRLVAYLGTTPDLGSSYVARLNNPAGVQMGMTQLFREQYRSIDNAVSFRLARLEQFLSEMGRD
jgi:hypothetical protein